MGEEGSGSDRDEISLVVEEARKRATGQGRYSWDNVGLEFVG